MNNLKIGDKVKLKYYNRDIYESKVIENKNRGFPYSIYITVYETYKDVIFIIKDIVLSTNFYYLDLIDSNTKHVGFFWEFQVKKISYLKTKYKIVNKILNENKRSY